jgi:hypothetical protein
MMGGGSYLQSFFAGIGLILAVQEEVSSPGLKVSEGTRGTRCVKEKQELRGRAGA